MNLSVVSRSAPHLAKYVSASVTEHSQAGLQDRCIMSTGATYLCYEPYIEPYFPTGATYRLENTA